jgi:hypothetical protein
MKPRVKKKQTPQMRAIAQRRKEARPFVIWARELNLTVKGRTVFLPYSQKTNPPEPAVMLQRLGFAIQLIID